MTMWITLVAMYAGATCCVSCCVWLFDWDWGTFWRGAAYLPWLFADFSCLHRADVAPLWFMC